MNRFARAFRDDAGLGFGCGCGAILWAIVITAAYLIYTAVFQ